MHVVPAFTRSTGILINNIDTGAGTGIRSTRVALPRNTSRGWPPGEGIKRVHPGNIDTGTGHTWNIECKVLVCYC
jgi:hypothetical protein